MFFLGSIRDICFSFFKIFLQHIMIKNPRPLKEKIIGDIWNLFRLNIELNYTPIKEIRNLFRIEKETKAIKDRILRGIKNFLRMKKKKKIIINQ